MPDFAVFQAIHDLAGQSKILDWAGIFLAQYLPYFMLLALAVLILRRRPSFNFLAFLALSVLLSRGLITEIFRFFYDKPRPFVSLDFSPLVNVTPTHSFPSGHAAAFFALAFALWFIERRFAGWFFIGAVFMGLARVFTGVHWPLDIVGGATVALLSVLCVKLILPFNKAVERRE